MTDHSQGPAGRPRVYYYRRQWRDQVVFVFPREEWRRWVAEYERAVPAELPGPSEKSIEAANAIVVAASRATDRSAGICMLRLQESDDPRIWDVELLSQSERSTARYHLGRILEEHGEKESSSVAGYFRNHLFAVGLAEDAQAWLHVLPRRFSDP